MVIKYKYKKEIMVKVKMKVRNSLFNKKIMRSINTTITIYKCN